MRVHLIRVIGLFLFFGIHQLTFAQKEANIWYFGENAGLDFNSGIPVPLLDGKLNTEGGCATISDINGSLLFYTDGRTVWNKSHQIMLNGTGLNGGSRSTHSAIVVPKPNDSNKYFIFTIDDFIGNNGLQYSEVDMTLDGGLGGITSTKNVLLHTPTTEKITAVKSAVAGAGLVGNVVRGTSVTTRGTALVAQYPANAAVSGTAKRTFLRPGQIIDRYGDLGGKWFSKPGTPYGARSIPPNQGPYMKFKVMKPFEVNSSLAAPGQLSGQVGFGIQFQSPVSLEILLKRGVLIPH